MSIANNESGNDHGSELTWPSIEWSSLWPAMTSGDTGDCGDGADSLSSFDGASAAFDLSLPETSFGDPLHGQFMASILDASDFDLGVSLPKALGDIEAIISEEATGPLAVDDDATKDIYELLSGFTPMYHISSQVQADSMNSFSDPSCTTMSIVLNTANTVDSGAALNQSSSIDFCTSVDSTAFVGSSITAEDIEKSSDMTVAHTAEQGLGVADDESLSTSDDDNNDDVRPTKRFKWKNLCTDKLSCCVS
ncbi:hypothetical protein BDY19DRAFT_998330 [Irpex rosettiformis]|uniref:Uncharacterized protein n=1 Tax=Irpex rosettiformis TaxID=378272 RepID=A0ACB8TP56_9APHY|nr:hypothetical protein BDY19DRAFT_998330 [Irpex rosettiformis]